MPCRAPPYDLAFGIGHSLGFAVGGSDEMQSSLHFIDTSPVLETLTHLRVIQEHIDIYIIYVNMFLNNHSSLKLM